MQTLTARCTSYARSSKKSVGTYPFYVPKAALDAPKAPSVVLRRNGAVRRTIKQ